MININKNESLGIKNQPFVRKRNIKKIPFIEFHNNKLQGVVSSGSSLERVYVCVINFEDKTYTCHTNNNRPCGGLRGKMCSHLSKLLMTARSEEKLSKIVDISSTYSFVPNGSARYSEVFSRFQTKLKFLEIPEPKDIHIPEIRWFLSK